MLLEGEILRLDGTDGMGRDETKDEDLCGLEAGSGDAVAG